MAHTKEITMFCSKITPKYPWTASALSGRLLANKGTTVEIQCASEEEHITIKYPNTGNKIQVLTLKHMSSNQ